MYQASIVTRQVFVNNSSDVGTRPRYFPTTDENKCDRIMHVGQFATNTRRVNIDREFQLQTLLLPSKTWLLNVPIVQPMSARFFQKGER